MSITVLNYHDQALVEAVSAKAAARAKAAEEAKAAKAAGDNDFSAILDETSQSHATTQNTASSANCPDNLNMVFEEAASVYGVSANLLKAIAKAESNFQSNAVSHAGAVGIMQLMPGTAASLGVSNSYDPRENIMGGAKLISQLLSKYNGNVSLALAAYNAGSGNVDKYGGIPPFTETQNYVKKVLSYLDGSVTVPSGNTVAPDSSTAIRDKANDVLSMLLSSEDISISKGSLELMAALLKLSHAGTPSSGTEQSASADTYNRNSGNSSSDSGFASASGVSSGSGTVSNPDISSDTGTDSGSENVDAFIGSDESGSGSGSPDNSAPTNPSVSDSVVDTQTPGLGNANTVTGGDGIVSGSLDIEGSINSSSPDSGTQAQTPGSDSVNDLESAGVAAPVSGFTDKLTSDEPAESDFGTDK